MPDTATATHGRIQTYADSLLRQIMDAVLAGHDPDGEYCKSLNDAYVRETTRGDWTTEQWYAWYGVDDKAGGETFPWHPGSTGYQGD